MNRQEALDLLNQNVKTRNLNKHMIATEACMRALAARLGEDRDEWALAGLLHDLDYDQTVNDFPRHGFVTEEILKGKGISEKIIGAIKAHTGNTPISGKMDLALFAVDPITGLIVAAGLMHPTRKLANVDVQFVMKRFKEKRFAAGANRDQIRKCEGLGLTLEDFVGVCLAAMQVVAEELEL